MKFYAFLFSLLVITACNNQPDAITEETPLTTNPAEAANDTANYTNIQWLDSVQNIGTLTKGENAEISYRFRNIGTKPLFIVSANPGCGCTVADYPKQAIKPGEEGVIKAGYDTKSQNTGAFYKSISVITNTLGNANHHLVFSGEILEADGTKKEPVSTSNQ